MPEKKNSRRVKKTQVAKNVKIRGGKDVAPELKEANEQAPCVVSNPIKKAIKLNQFPWTDKQKEFFRIALHPSTNIVFVSGPAGTSKTLLATYCALQLLNMKSIEEIMYLRSAVESSAQSLGFLPGSAEDKLKFYKFYKFLLLMIKIYFCIKNLFLIPKIDFWFTNTNNIYKSKRKRK